MLCLRRFVIYKKTNRERNEIINKVNNRESYIILESEQKWQEQTIYKLTMQEHTHET